MSGRVIRWLLSLIRRPSFRDGAGPHLTILRHHRIYREDERPLYRLGVSERVFNAQLDWLVRQGLTPVTVAAGLEWLDSASHGHRVAMSFDDGYEDNVTLALPRLREAGAAASFYLTAGLIETRRAPWWDELAHALERTTVPHLRFTVGDQELELPLGPRSERVIALRRLVPAFRLPLDTRTARMTELYHRLHVTGPAPCALATWEQAAALQAAGMEVGAHTLAHPHLSLLAPQAQREEIEGSIEHIDDRLKQKPAGFAYPDGDYDRTTVQTVEDLGLAYAVTTHTGVNTSGPRRFELRRRGFPEAACLDPAGRFSGALAAAELHGAFDRMRGIEEAA